MENTRTVPTYRQDSASPEIRQAAYSLVRGQATDPAWVRPALWGLLGSTGLLYLWNLAASGWANAYYSAAVLAGTKNWAAFFFGSLDASNFITVDKAPASLWVMEISARLFGFNAWSVLAPQALEGVATVGIIYLAVRRWFGPAAGLLAGAVVALTPVAGLMFRFNNPDALLVLLITAATYATLRAVENGRTRWLVLAGVLIGVGFLAKELQAFIVIPVLAGVYLFAGPPSIGRRICQVLAAAVAVIVSSGWWIAAVELVPSASRPYIGGSQNNDLISLIFGYNGFGRLTGNESGSIGGFGALGSRWGLTGWNRLFNSQFGGQVSWLLPGALILLGASLLLSFRRPRTNIVRAAFLVWGGSLLLTGAVFSLAQGIIHPYYTVALAPAIGALVGMGGAYLWQRRSELVARLAMGGAVAATVVWSFVLLGRSSTFLPGLGAAVLVAGLVAAALIVGLSNASRKAVLTIAAVGLMAVLAGPAAYTFDTVATAHSGAIPSAGPAIAGGGFPGGGGGGRFVPPGGALGGGFGGGQLGRGPNSAFGGGGGNPGSGGFLDSSRPAADLVSLLEANASRYTWVAATTRANSAAGYELATGDPVMAIGGFNGTDPAPTLAQFQQYVHDGKIHYFVAGGSGPGSASTSSTASQITAWVQQNFTPTAVGGVTVYDLTTSAG
ncbi:MAG: glycosyltransferase family 39 protein [Chloroflexi bacterium]|nr:MAG: glycosyltransferase family 39 protein [Chloroflexota bacterium]